MKRRRGVWAHSLCSDVVQDSPSTCDNGARSERKDQLSSFLYKTRAGCSLPRTRHGRTGVYTTRPIGVDVVLVPPQLDASVHDNRGSCRQLAPSPARIADRRLTFRTESVFVLNMWSAMSHIGIVRRAAHDVAANTRHTGDRKVKSIDTVAQPCFLQEWHEERAQTAVDVETDFLLLSNCAKVLDRVLSIDCQLQNHKNRRYTAHNDAIWEIGRRSDNHNGVGIAETRSQSVC